jgi:chromosome segregation ATPase
MNRGMTAQQQLLNTVIVELDGGFKTLHNDMQAAMHQEKALHQEIKQIQQQILQATDETTVLRTHKERLVAEAQQTQTLVEQMQTSTRAIVDSQGKITAAVHKQTETSVYNTNRLLESNQQTRAAIQKMGQQARKVAQGGSSGGNSGGGILGTVIGAVSSWF